jgi:endonuclease/exonuclease/phosphatase family metal-dependent hydrolase
VDDGSIRSNFINLTEYLAERGSFPYWYHQINRNLGRFAKHSNGILSQFDPAEIRDLRLPGLIPGRQAIMARYASGAESLAVFIVHLALSRRARLQQLDYLADMINEHPHAIIMGDMNCRHDSKEMQLLFNKTRLHEPLEQVFTFPSWRPQFNIDHILVTSELKVRQIQQLDNIGSDHLPIMLEVELPSGMTLERRTFKKSLSFDEYLKGLKA